MQRIDWNEGWMFSADGKEAHPVTLPHDAMQEQGRSADAPSGQGCAWFRGGKYVYTKTFTAPAEWKDKTVLFETEGIYPHAEVRLNGQLLGKCIYGYTGCRFEMTGSLSESAFRAADRSESELRTDVQNILEVTVDHTLMPDSRWYSGSGMYRPVHLIIGNRTAHLVPDSLKVTTLSLRPAKIRIEAEIAGMKTGDTGSQATPAVKPDWSGYTIPIQIRKDGNLIAETALRCISGTSIALGELTIPDALLWSAEEPNLYECRAQLACGTSSEILEEASVRFGIRTLRWSPEGFFVNGSPILLKGGCIHHDNGILGSRSYSESEYRRVSRMKQMGFNAVRSAHNPACRALLDACDELGMYVMDEGWDMWYKSKNPYDYGAKFEENWRRDASAMVAKDYNHPSVILYSIGNEVTEPKEKKGVQLAKGMTDFFHRLDQTRPVTCGINITLLLLAKMGIDLTKGKDDKKSDGSVSKPKKEVSSTDFNKMMSTGGDRMNKASAGFFADRISSPVLDALDIAGYNYASARYAKEGRKHPGRVIVGTETYPHKLYENWAMVKKYPYLTGDFMWTAWDYLGETGIGSWTYPDGGSVQFEKTYPWLLADTGAFDILGNDNAEAGNAAVIWGARKKPYIAVMPVTHPWDKAVVAMWRGSNAIPSWSWAGCEGISTQVEVYTQGSTVKLYLNDRLVGEEAAKEGRAVFHPDYEPGELLAAAFDAEGRMIGKSMLRSAAYRSDHAAAPAFLPSVRILPEEKLTSDSIRYIDIDLIGDNGEIECAADRLLSVNIRGAELLAFGSADPKTEDNFLSGTYHTYYGRALAVIRTAGKSFTITVTDRENGNTTSLTLE